MTDAQAPDPEDLVAQARALRRLARTLVSDAHAAEDLAQEAWLELLEGRATRAGARNPVAWLGGLLRNLRRERARGEGRRARREREVSRPEAVGGDQDLVERLEVFRLLAAEVELLDEPYRTSLWQRFFEGASAEQIAAREGLSPATVRSRWKRALDRLRERLDHRQGGRERWMASLALVAEETAPKSGGHGAALLVAASTLLATIVAVVWLNVPDAETVLSPLARGARHEPDPASARGADPPESAASSGRSALEVAREAELVRDAAAPRSPLRLVLVDARTLEPIPAGTLRVTASGMVREATSDALGRAVVTELPHGECGVELLEDPSEPPRPLEGEVRAFRRSRPVAHTGEHEAEVRVPIGPTYLFDLVLPAQVGADGLVARLSAPGRSGPRASARARVRAAAASAGAFLQPWARFEADAAALDGGGPWTLRVESADGRFAAEAPVTDIVGQQGKPLELALTERAELEVRVRGADGRPIEGRVHVRAPGGAVVARGEVESGSLRARGLEPGTHLVSVLVLGREPREERVEVLAGTHAVEIVLPRGAEPGRVQGVLRHRAVEGEDVRVVLRDARGAERSTRVSPSPAGDARLPFAFDEVPAGEYELVATSRRVWLWDPPRLRLTAPAADLLIQAITPESTSQLVVRARDAASGERIEHFDIRLAVQGGALVERSTSTAGITLPELPAAVPLAWTVAAVGFVPVHGDEHALQWSEDRRVLDVELRRGFGLHVLVVDHDSGVPLAGAAVLLDGRERARSDAAGEARVIASTRPRTISVSLADHAVVGGDVDPVTGAWWPGAPGRLEVRLARRR
ncbi:MAG: sigma-70 family RNA polymerase sigma factor [Planctomycetes bacterium]|nr:sigma-70 family RNA polymerase sigma factor [Planctomycetota bacterium]